MTMIMGFEDGEKERIICRAGSGVGKESNESVI